MSSSGSGILDVLDFGGVRMLPFLKENPFENH